VVGAIGGGGHGERPPLATLKLLRLLKLAQQLCARRAERFEATLNGGQSCSGYRI
jgi:hypothetical protein